MTKLRCAILDDYQNVALTMANWNVIADHVNVTSFQQRFHSEDELVGAIGDCEIVVIMRERTPFRGPLFVRLTRLRLLVTTGMKNAAIDLDSAAAHGVVVCGTASQSDPPAELTWALILGLARNVVQEHMSFVTGGPWQTTIGADLSGQRLGLIGFGKIGAKVARVGLAFGMDVVAWSQNLTAEQTAPAGVRLASSKEELLETSDVVSIHLVLSKRTRGLIGADDLRRMRPSAYLINTSRAPIVDQTALVEALRKGWIAGAGLDVFDAEPPSEDDPVRSAPNLLATPHLGYVTRANYGTYFKNAVEDISAFLAGSPIRVLTI